MVNHLFGNVLPLYPHRLEEYKDLILKRVMLAPQTESCTNSTKKYWQLWKDQLLIITVWTRLTNMMETPLLIFRWNI